ncbi:MAG: 2-oxoacid:acceptor oxidoreductase family protein [Myxococcales bacterium]|nr:2-oxoacid:acceptor oxidoreductase family protein [Myxococcales bacterium]
MLRIRFHGRGGQGIKTASRVLGSALFAEGFEVQDAPRYGAERRGAPIFAYVRADRAPIDERGVIERPELVVVGDDSLVQVAGAGVGVGLDAEAVLLLLSQEPAAVWKQRLQTEATVITLEPPAPDPDAPLRSGPEPLVGARVSGAAARLLGVVPRTALEAALAQELGALPTTARERARQQALEAFDALAAHAGAVRARPAPGYAERTSPGWIELPFDPADVSAPAIHAPATSVLVRTGLWRSMRPVIDHSGCKRCHFMCALPCPDSAITVDDAGYPQIDLEHCKGCLICVAQCPFHVIAAVPEAEAQNETTALPRERRAHEP